jgi:hypothetical protein
VVIELMIIEYSSQNKVSVLFNNKRSKLIMMVLKKITNFALHKGRVENIALTLC